MHVEMFNVAKNHLEQQKDHVVVSIEQFKIHGCSYAKPKFRSADIYRLATITMSAASSAYIIWLVVCE